MSVRMYAAYKVTPGALAALGDGVGAPQNIGRSTVHQ
jgi:hypothetical protein